MVYTFNAAPLKLLFYQTCAIEKQDIFISVISNSYTNLLKTVRSQITQSINK